MWYENIRSVHGEYMVHNVIIVCISATYDQLWLNTHLVSGMFMFILYLFQHTQHNPVIVGHTFSVWNVYGQIVSISEYIT